MNTRRLLLAPLAAFVISACTPPAPPPPPPPDTAAIRASIDAANAKFVAAFVKRDTAHVADNYADDAIVFPPGEPAAHGRAAISGSLNAMLGAMASIKDFSDKTEDVMVSGDVAIESGTYTSAMTPKKGKEMADHGKYVTVWKKQADGSWKIVRDIFNSDIPPKM